MRFVLIGGGAPQDMAALRRQAQAAGVSARFTLLGNRPDPEVFFPGLDLLALTSINEGTPVSILEGGACALGVVATRVGGVPDLLGPAREELPGRVRLARRGLLVAGGDAGALAAGLAWLADHPGQASALGKALQGYVLSRHGKDRLCADIADLYQGVLSA